MRIRGLGAGIAAMLALGIAPASAAAVDRYVDAETGDNSNVGCPQATPCETIASALANSSPGDQILIDNGTYLESVTVGGGRSLTGLDFVDGDGTAPPTIDGGAGTAVTVPASGASLIRGLRIRGDTAGVRLDGPAEVTDNLIDDPDATAAIGVHVAAGDDSAIHGNTIVDPAPGPGGSRQGVALFPVSGVHVADNTIQGMAIGISVPGATDPPIIARNLIEGTHGDFGAAIRVYCCTPLTSVLRGNTIRDPGTPLPNGIVLDDDAVLERNEVTGHDEGIFFSADTVGTTLDGDRIWGNNQGLYVFDNNPVPTQTSLSVTNATIVGNGGDVNVSQSHVALDSSIVGTMGGGINSSCTITFSRGDAIGNHPTGCDSFQTAADPMFVDPDDGDFHLAPGSPMIDMGNPASGCTGDGGLRRRSTRDHRDQRVRSPPRHRRRRVPPGVAGRLRAAGHDDHLRARRGRADQRGCSGDRLLQRGRRDLPVQREQRALPAVLTRVPPQPRPARRRPEHLCGPRHRRGRQHRPQPGLGLVRGRHRGARDQLSPRPRPRSRRRRR